MRCPVCRMRVVPDRHHNIATHRNSIGRLCVQGSGQPIEICRGWLR